jgi:hypothetical protein
MNVVPNLSLVPSVQSLGANKRLPTVVGYGSTHALGFFVFTSRERFDPSSKPGVRQLPAMESLSMHLCFDLFLVGL